MPDETGRPRVVVGVAGGIAAYKSCELVRLLTESGHAVRVIPTASALRFVGAATWAALSGQPVATDVWDDVHPDLAGRHVVVSAGGTREHLDPVRFLGNRSSGRQGYALASAAVIRGAEVTLVSANVALPDPAGAKLVRVVSALDLRDAVK